jgi:hypothetical protein
MAGRWAKSIVHVVPVFGESGGLLEHFVFDVFFNLPLTIKRGFKKRPVRWTILTVAFLSLVGLLLWGAYVKVSGWLHPIHQLDDVRVVAVTPYPEDAEPDAAEGMHIELEGYDGVIEFPIDRWTDTIVEGDTVDAQVRGSRWGDDSVGLAIIEQGP